MTGHQKLQGSPFYMSPEQIERDPSIDSRTDVYSLGVVLYEALTGRTPTEGDNIDDIIRGTLNDTPPLPSELAPAIPSLLEETVMQCLQKKKEARVQKAGELVYNRIQPWYERLNH